ncbi:MAG: universal stress protein [Dethiobacteria bacterium]
MKILVCTDGSEYSQKALKQASLIAEGCNIDEVAIIHVYENKQTESPLFISSDKQAELIRLVAEELQVERKKILEDALTFFKEKNIKPRTILKEGHPSHTIVSVAAEEGFDMIFIGSRGLSGLEKVFLGSVSNAVAQEAKNCSVVIVK